MTKLPLLAATLCLPFSLAWGALTYDDNKYIKAYNKEIGTLNRNYGALRSIEDYKNPQKRATVEAGFHNLKKIIKSFSDQKDPQVVTMQRSYKSMVTTYNKNLKTAGVKVSTPSSNAKKPTQKRSLATLIEDYNRLYSKAFNDYNAMTNATAVKDKQKQQVLHQDYKALTETILAIKERDISVYNNASKGYEEWVSAYKELSKNFDGVASSSTDTAKMTAEDRRNLKKFRSLYIANDYYFRNVDTVKLQDSAYRKPLEKTLHQLQALLNPMRSKTFDRGVKQADKDLLKIEKIFAQASANSKTLAASAGNIEEELKAIQTVFNRETFDPRLQRDYISGEARRAEEVKEWAKQLKEYKHLIPDMKTFLDTARNNTIEGRKPAFASYRSWFNNSVEDDINDAILDATRRWETEMHNGIFKFRTYSKNDLKTRLNNQNSVAELLQELTVGLKALENQKVYEQVMDGKLSAKTQAYSKDYKVFDYMLKDAKVASLKNQKLPSAISNPKLLSIATSKFKPEALKKMSHINVHTNEAESKVLKYEDGWYLLHWKAFSVSFVEKIGNKYFIKYASFRKELSNRFGARHNGEWYVSQVSPKGTQIPKENL